MAKRNKKLRRAVKKAGEDITRKEAKKILKAAGGNVKRATTVTSKKGGTLRASAANLFIKQAAVPTRDSWKGFGSSKLAKTLQSYAGTPGTAGRMYQGRMVGATEGTPGKGMFDKGARIDPRTGRVGYRPIGAAGAGGGELPPEVTDEGTSTTIGGPGGPGLPEIPLPEEEPMLGTGTGGAALGEGAIGIRRKQRRGLARLLGIGTKQFNRAYQRMQINLGQ